MPSAGLDGLESGLGELRGDSEGGDVGCEGAGDGLTRDGERKIRIGIWEDQISF